MVIKNEIQNLQKNFSDIFKYFEDVIIVDTGSTDGCIEYLKDNFSLKVIKSEIVESTAFSKSPCRNIALEQVKTDWILSLDADEQITVDSLKSIQNDWDILSLKDKKRFRESYFERFINKQQNYISSIHKT